MGRDAKKIESIAVNAISQVVDSHNLLHSELKTNDKTISFDGHIDVFREEKHKKENYFGQVPVQIKGREINSFKRDKCSFQVEKNDLKIFMQESGVIFFVVEILKDQDTTKIFWKQLLPYDIDKVLRRIEKRRKKSGYIELTPLESQDLTLICQNFIVDGKKQKHGVVKTVSEIEGLQGLNISAIIGRFGAKTTNGCIMAFNDYILAKKPLYLNVDIGNNLFIPIANITDGDFILAFQDYDEVWVDDICFGSRYFSSRMNQNGCYYQFGQSSKFFLDGTMNFSAIGTLDERIKDIEFILTLLKGGRIRLGKPDAPEWPALLPGNDISISEIEQKLAILQTTKQVLSFLGANVPVKIADFKEDDFRKILVLSEHIIHGKECPVKFKNEGINVLKIGQYNFIVVVFQKKIINLFSNDFWKSVRVSSQTHDDTQFDISPYYFLNAEYIAGSANWNATVVMESIRAVPFSEPVSSLYTSLLLETIKAIDIDTKNNHVMRFANDLADYLCENEDSFVHRLNKLQIKKRSGTFDDLDKNWLIAELNRQNDPMLLCGVAILLADKILFEKQFARLTQTQQNDFQQYPIMKLIDKQDVPKKSPAKRKSNSSTNGHSRLSI